MLGTLVGLELNCARPQKDATAPPERCTVTGESATSFEWGKKYYRLSMVDDKSRPYVARLTKKGAPRLACVMRIYCVPPRLELSDNDYLPLHEEIAKCWRDASFYVREVLFSQPGMYLLEFALSGDDLDSMFASSPAPLRYTCTVARGAAHIHRPMSSQQKRKQRHKQKQTQKPKRARTGTEEQIDATRARRQKKARASGKLVLSEPLLKCVVADWTSVMQRGEVAPLPCSAERSVDAILARFAAHIAASRKSQREDSTAGGLIAAVPHLLERFLHTTVLFHSEGDGAPQGAAVPRESECDRYDVFCDLLKSEEQRTLSAPLDDAKVGDALVGSVLWAPPQPAIYTVPTPWQPNCKVCELELFPSIAA